MRRVAGRLGRGLASGVEWFFGLLSLLLGLATLAALPVIQVVTLGYFLESSARVARTGRLRDGLIGVRKAARIGGLAAAIWVALIPAWLVGSYARAAALIDPDGPTARHWQIGQLVAILVSFFYVAVSCTEAADSAIFSGLGASVLARSALAGWGPLWGDTRRALAICLESARALLFSSGTGWLRGNARLARGSRGPDHVDPPLSPAGAVGVILLALIVPFLPFLQVRYAVEGHVSALFSRRAIRDRFHRVAVGFCLLAFHSSRCRNPALLAQSRNDPTRGSLVAKPGLCRLPGTGPAADRLGLCTLRPS